MRNIEKYCGELEDFLEGDFDADADSLEWVASGVSVYTERLARALKTSKNSRNPQIRPIWQKLFYFSKWVLKHPESVADEEVRDTILFAVAQVYQAIEWELI
ncbi:hypothetical protein ACMZ7J_02995 [Gardnerella greenwoodii]|uniref:hypothetical protein n=1 Tax=Gardnerella greenwoodii TaxID=2914925 RepID=UPI0039F0E9A1